MPVRHFACSTAGCWSAPETATATLRAGASTTTRRRCQQNGGRLVHARLAIDNALWLARACRPPPASPGERPRRETLCAAGRRAVGRLPLVAFATSHSFLGSSR